MIFPKNQKRAEKIQELQKTRSLCICDICDARGICGRVCELCRQQASSIFIRSEEEKRVVISCEERSRSRRSAARALQAFTLAACGVHFRIGAISS
jgi:ribosomal protein L32